MLKKIKAIISLLVIVVCGIISGTNKAESAGPTHVYNDLNGNVSWTEDGSPYIVHGWVWISETIVIDPGVIVKFDKGSRLLISGANEKLEARGTNEKKIIFTSIKDDSIGGDSNGDGDGTFPQPGDWGGIYIGKNSKAYLENTVFSYGSEKNNVAGMVTIFSEDVSIKNSKFQKAGYSGVCVYNLGGQLIENNIFSENPIGIFLNSFGAPDIISNVVSNNTTGIYMYNSSPLSVRSNLISKNVYGVRVGANSYPKLENNAIFDNFAFGIGSTFPALSLIDAKNNWWGDKSGPYYKHGGVGTIPENINGKGNPVSDNVAFSPWLGKNPIDKEGCQENCFSSVMFLPGIQTTRLYKKDSDGSVDQLWEPTNHNEDVRQLYLDSEGNGLEGDVYAGEVIDEVYGFTSNIYKKFMGFMDGLVQNGDIEDWKAFPYDWRMSLEKIVDEGTRLSDGSVLNVISEIEKMAQDSKSEKVTLVGHSNGGLLAKVVMDRLEKSGKAGLIDKIIMIGTPQVGTPKAVASVLHGDETNLLHGIILDKATGRGFAENMQGAYNLLPSRKYFEIVDDPVIKFGSDVGKIYDFRSIYEDNIASFGEFRSFLLGDNGKRSEPEMEDTDSPNVLKENLFSRSTDLHDNLLDSWKAPQDIEVIQIAGWGLDTISGIEYDDCDILFCPDNLSNLDRRPIFTEDGDGTVVVPSAVVMEDVKKYYVDIKTYNSFGEFKVNRSHADILEIGFLLDFIRNIIKNNNDPIGYITIEKPEVQNESKRLRYGLHSPVALHIYDEKGNHTGLIENPNPNSNLRLYEQQIPNSYYMEFGESKYAGSEGNISQKVVLEGENLGTFTFEIDEIFGSGEIKNTSFENIPTIKGMKAEISITDSVEEMKIDLDGDLETDFVFKPGEEIARKDLVGMLKGIISMLDIHETTKKRLLEKVGNAQKQFEKNNENSANAMLENVIHQIKVFSGGNTPEKFRISIGDAEKLINIIEKITNN